MARTDFFGSYFIHTSLTPVFHTGNLVIDPVWGNHPSVQPREVKVYPEGEPNSNMFQCAVKFLVLPPDVLPVVFFRKAGVGSPGAGAGPK